MVGLGLIGRLNGDRALMMLNVYVPYRSMTSRNALDFAGLAIEGCFTCLSQNASSLLSSNIWTQGFEKEGVDAWDFMSLSCLRFCHKSAEMVEFPSCQFSFSICTFSPYALIWGSKVKQ